jgi:hypothetical protein
MLGGVHLTDRPNGDDGFARLDHVAIADTRQVEFGRLLP